MYVVDISLTTGCEIRVCWIWLTKTCLLALPTAYNSARYWVYRISFLKSIQGVTVGHVGNAMGAIPDYNLKGANEMTNNTHNRAFSERQTMKQAARDCQIAQNKLFLFAQSHCASILFTFSPFLSAPLHRCWECLCKGIYTVNANMF